MNISTYASINTYADSDYYNHYNIKNSAQLYPRACLSFNSATLSSTVFIFLPPLCSFFTHFSKFFTYLTNYIIF